MLKFKDWNIYTESAHGRKAPLDNELKSTGLKYFLRELRWMKNKFAVLYELLLARRVPKVQKLAEAKVEEVIMVNCELCKDQTICQFIRGRGES